VVLDVLVVLVLAVELEPLDRPELLEVVVVVVATAFADCAAVADPAFACASMARKPVKATSADALRPPATLRDLAAA
jgi:hypothetical protein